ncbi:MAG: FxsA family protein [Hyphomicrobiaceae bacterium]
MQFGILLLMAALPIIELALLIKLGQVLGFWGTLALIFGTGVLGVALIWGQGLALLARMREVMTGQRSSGDLDIEGSIIFLAGFLLMLPGPITDCLGLFLLIPAVRYAIGRQIRRRIQIFTVHASGPEPDTGQAPSGPIIEGEFERLDETNGGTRRSSNRRG